MRRFSRWRRSAALLSAVALVAAACATDDDVAAPDEPVEAPDDVEAPPEPTDEIAFDIGVTEEPCPDGVNPDNGCIYLGVLSDLSDGPFAGLAIPLTQAQADFFQRVNEQGGIGGFDIDVTTYTRDTHYDPQDHSAAYREIEPNILALAQTLGTPPTEAILRDMDDDDVIGIPMSWWSGWDFPDVHRGLIMPSGYSYCIESMIGLDWYTEQQGEPSSVIAVGYPTDFGLDAGAGAELWAEANGVEYVGFVETAPNAIVGTQDAAISQVVGSGADVVVLAVGPAETAEIVGGSAANEFTGMFMGSLPTWNPALMATPAAPALEALYRWVTPFENLVEGDSAAHEAMREALGDGLLDTNDGYAAGWVMTYPIKAALEQAVANGDLTRAGLRAAVDGLSVDYEGSLPPRTYGVGAAELALREAVISVPDPDAPWGAVTLETGVTGPTAQAFDYPGPCVGG